MSGTDPAAAAEAARQAAEAEAKKQQEAPGSSLLGDVAEVAADAVDLVGTVVEGVASAIGGLLDP